MPGGDRTGPLGAGPGTGRGMGYCRGFNQPGYANLTPGGRGNFGFRRFGMGRGWRNRFQATGLPVQVTVPPEQETANLKAQAGLLQEQLDVIQKRLDELKA